VFRRSMPNAFLPGQPQIDLTQAKLKPFLRNEQLRFLNRWIFVKGGDFLLKCCNG
jgi:hypothetical protein